MLDKVKEFLKSNDYEYFTDGDSIVVDCGGQDFKYVSLVESIYEHIEVWTYEMLMNIKIVLFLSIMRFVNI